MVADDERPSASETVHGSVMFPGEVAAGIVIESEYTRSPPVASPFVPSSKKLCVAEPPTAVRSQVTARPVLAGVKPGVTDTVSSVELPAGADAGDAAPTPVGAVQS